MASQVRVLPPPPAFARVTRFAGFGRSPTSRKLNASSATSAPATPLTGKECGRIRSAFGETGHAERRSGHVDFQRRVRHFSRADAARLHRPAAGPGAVAGFDDVYRGEDDGAGAERLRALAA